jgi:hypothetical protein
MRTKKFFFFVDFLKRICPLEVEMLLYKEFSENGGVKVLQGVHGELRG